MNMARLPRVVATGLPHHVTQRGNYRQNVFFTDSDRLTYLGLLCDYARQARLRLIGYCLITNHVHLIVIPERENSLARGVGQAHCRYAHAVHARQQATGHLWQNRFFSTVMDEAHLLCAMRYVETNPVRAGMVADASDYRWSSAQAHLGGHDSTASLDLKYWQARVRAEDWRRELKITEEAEEMAMIRSLTASGRPIGSKEFIAGLARQMQRVLQARPPGRPKKSAEGQNHAVQTALF
jgi:putative transposase